MNIDNCIKRHFNRYHGCAYPNLFCSEFLNSKKNLVQKTCTNNLNKLTYNNLVYKPFQKFVEQLQSSSFGKILGHYFDKGSSCNNMCSNTVNQSLSNDTSKKSCTTFPSLQTSSPFHGLNTLEADVDENGKTTITTQDGYKISCTGKNQEWFITDQIGNQTRIWGDPHVVESDGDTWDFHEQSSFLFGNNKVTVTTTPQNSPTGIAYTSSINVYNGRERIEVSGINSNDPKITAMKKDAPIHDVLTPDGNRYYLAKEANGDDAWIIVD